MTQDQDHATALAWLAGRMQWERVLSDLRDRSDALAAAVVLHTKDAGDAPRPAASDAAAERAA